MSVLAYQIDPSVSRGKFQASFERRLEYAGEEKNPEGNVLEKNEKSEAKAEKWEALCNLSEQAKRGEEADRL